MLKLAVSWLIGARIFMETEWLWRLKLAKGCGIAIANACCEYPNGILAWYAKNGTGGERRETDPPDRWSVGVCWRALIAKWDAINGSTISGKIEETIGSFISERKTSYAGHISCCGKDFRFMDREYCGVRLPVRGKIDGWFVVASNSEVWRGLRNPAS